MEVVELDMTAEDSPTYSAKYVKSAEWDLVNALKVRSTEQYECCQHPLADVTLVIEMERKPLFYVFTLVVPCMIILSMILLGFFLPPESGERITLSITVLLAMAVFLQLVGESLPRNSETIPLLGVFYIIIMAEISISLILTCFVLNIHYRGASNSSIEVPIWVKIVVLQWLGYILCVRRPNERRAKTEMHQTFKGRRYDELKRKGLMINDYEMAFSPSISCHCNRCASTKGNFHHINSPEETRLLDSRFIAATSPLGSQRGLRERTVDSKISEEIKVLADNIRYRERIEYNQEDWKYFAMVLDRLFFWMYCTTILISTLTVFLQIPPRTSNFL